MRILIQRILKLLPHRICYSINGLLYKPNHLEVKGLRQIRDKGLLLIRVPKTGSQAVSYTIFGDTLIGHKKAVDYKVLISSNEFKELYKCAIVRNPFDRLESAYFYLRDGGGNKADQSFSQKVLTKYNSYEQFVLEGLESKEVQAYIHFIPQYRFVNDYFGRRMIDHLINYESLDQGFNLMVKKIGIKADLKRRNTTSNREAVHYSKNMVNKIVSVYLKDFRLGSYDF